MGQFFSQITFKLGNFTHSSGNDGFSPACPCQKFTKIVQRYIILRGTQINDSVTCTCPSSSFKSEVLAMARSSVS